MKCITHNDKDAVWQCNTCGWWLCKDCIHNFSKPICPNCNLKYWEQNVKDLNSSKYTVPMYWFWVAIILFMLTWQWVAGGINQYHSNLLVIFIFALYWVFWILTFIGWIWISSINENTVTIRTNDTLIWMVIRNTFKLIFSLIVWVFVWPYKVYKLTQEYKESIRMIEVCKKLIHK